MNRNDYPKGGTPPVDPKLMEKISASPQARELADTLSRQMDTAVLKKIAADAAQGDTAALSRLIKDLTARDDTAKLLQQLKDSLGR